MRELTCDPLESDPDLVEAMLFGAIQHLVRRCNDLPADAMSAAVPDIMRRRSDLPAAVAGAVEAVVDINRSLNTCMGIFRELPASDAKEELRSRLLEINVWIRDVLRSSLEETP